MLLGLLTYALVNVTWVFFRSKDFAKAWQVLKGMFGLNAAAEPILAGAHLIAVAAIVGGIVFAHWRMRARTLESLIAATPAVVIAGRVGNHAVCHHRRAGDGQCLHLFPVLSA